jgi:hypothetical protein
MYGGMLGQEVEIKFGKSGYFEPLDWLGELVMDNCQFHTLENAWCTLSIPG